MPSSIEIDVRDVLKTALSGIAASVYSSPPEAVIPPACVIVPDAVYLETVTVGSGAIRVKINFVITAAVAYNNTAGALDGLEKLIISILTALPLETLLRQKFSEAKISGLVAIVILLPD